MVRKQKGHLRGNFMYFYSMSLFTTAWMSSISHRFCPVMHISPLWIPLLYYTVYLFLIPLMWCLLLLLLLVHFTLFIIFYFYVMLFSYWTSVIYYFIFLFAWTFFCDFACFIYFIPLTCNNSWWLIFIFIFIVIFCNILELPAFAHM